MTINETPVDCFRVKYFISGSEQEIIEEERNILLSFHTCHMEQSAKKQRKMVL